MHHNMIFFKESSQILFPFPPFLLDSVRQPLKRMDFTNSPLNNNNIIQNLEHNEVESTMAEL